MQRIVTFVTTLTLAAAFGSTAAYANPVPPPQNGIYLGAFVKGDVNGRAASQAQREAGSQVAAVTASFESQMAEISGRPRVLALHLHFYNWKSISRVDDDPAIADDFAKGRTPVLTWTCGDSLRSIAGGADDDSIVTVARAIAALRKPVMIRWFHEFNFNLAPGSRANGQAENCFDTSAGEAGEAQDFIAAWRHIHDIFTREGATNVSWIWCPGASPNVVRRRNLMAFFPGSEYVDWIGGDFYDRKGQGFVQTAMPFYTMVHQSQPNMPIIIAETGEEAASGGSASQAAYFESMESNLPSTFPQIKALIYFDAPGNRPNNFVMTPDGFNAFAKMAANPYFTPMP